MATKEYMKRWREDNKDKIKKYNIDKVTCECGMILSRINLSLHRKTKKHLNIMAGKEDKIVDDVIEKLKVIQDLQIDDDTKRKLIDKVKKKLDD
jgi:hypothetical protein